jgi:hypothetical protein
LVKTEWFLRNPFTSLSSDEGDARSDGEWTVLVERVIMVGGDDGMEGDGGCEPGGAAKLDEWKGVEVGECEGEFGGAWRLIFGYGVWLDADTWDFEA